MKSFLVKLSGGLGNQMFQYAFAKALSLRLNIDFRLDVSNYQKVSGDLRSLEIFLFPNIHEKTVEDSFLAKYILADIFPYKQIHKFMTFFPIDPVFFVNHVYFEKKYSMEDNLRNLVDFESKPIASVFLGNWQNEAFFKDVEYDIRNALAFPLERLSERTMNLADNLGKMSDSVSLHVRRGDYLSSQYSSFYGGVCTEAYYEAAMKHIENECSSPRYIIFSDDMDWCRQNLRLPKNSIYVDWNEKEHSWQDMFLISKCRHHIVANSSFSWWGAWLGTSDGITIAPKRWYADDSWEKNAGQFVPSSKWKKVME